MELSGISAVVTGAASGLGAATAAELAARGVHVLGIDLAAGIEKMGDGGVADGVGVGLGAVVHQVEVGDGRPPGQPIGDTGQVKPGREESGGLRPLSGSNEYEHPSNFLVSG